jgi:hypothetical protein
MGGCTVMTIKAHVAAIKWAVQNSWLIRKTPTCPPSGPMPIADQVGMGMAVDMLFNSLTAKPHMKGQAFIQFDSMHRPRATFTSAWELSPAGSGEGSTFALGSIKVTVTTCPTQQKWFNLFVWGAENRMGYVLQRNQPFGTGVVARMLELVIEEAKLEYKCISGEYFKFGATAALALCASLRASKVFLLDLAGLWKIGSGGRKASCCSTQ